MSSLGQRVWMSLISSILVRTLQFEVDNNQVGTAGLNGLDGLVAILGLAANTEVLLTFKDLRQAFTDQGMVIHDEYAAAFAERVRGPMLLSHSQKG